MSDRVALMMLQKLVKLHDGLIDLTSLIQQFGYAQLRNSICRFDGKRSTQALLSHLVESVHLRVEPTEPGLSAGGVARTMRKR